ncbi:MAG TPA: hypothetical protein VN635_12545 [Conexibacter sp.]|nr:hypothetical protein [Conexibacter sp.]
MSRLARQTPIARLLAVMLAAALLLAVAGCGSSKPGYCSDRSRLESSIRELNPSSGLSGIESQLRTIQSNANALVASAKSDFPTETAAIRTSIDTFSGAIRALPSNPSPSQIASLATDASSVVSAVNGFVDATKSKCE